jgi:hypothetical protein
MTQIVRCNRCGCTNDGNDGRFSLASKWIRVIAYSGTVTVLEKDLCYDCAQRFNEFMSSAVVNE